MKVTRATLKAFLKKNQGNLYIVEHSRFNSMYDMVTTNEDQKWSKLEGTYDAEKGATLGFNGIWTVRGSRDYFDMVTVVSQEGIFEGIRCHNCCGCWTVAILKG